MTNTFTFQGEGQGISRATLAPKNPYTHARVRTHTHTQKTVFQTTTNTISKTLGSEMWDFVEFFFSSL